MPAFYFACFSIILSQAVCQAHWILPEGIQFSPAADGREEAVPNQWFCFRKQFELDHVPPTVSARIACDSKYWLWVNGRIVVREGQLKRGPTPTGTYVDIVELQDYLQNGSNTVALLLWYFGKDGFSHNSSGLPGLYIESHEIGLASDNSWRAIRNSAFGNSVAPHPNYRLPESNVFFDARKDMPGWQESDFDDSYWPEAKSASKSQKTNWGELVPRPILQWRYSQLSSYRTQREQVDESGKQIIEATLPYNAQVHAYLKVISPPGKTISIRTDNYRGGSEYNARTDYVTREGVQEFESPIWMNGHEVHYAIPPDVEVVDLKYRESGYDTDLVGSFQCDDEFLNRLWQKAQRTLYVNMRDTYFDCPDRERAQWWGDVTLLLTESFYALDRRADQLTRKGILELAAWQRSDGTLFSPIPAGNWDNELPLQMLASVGRYGFWTYYEHTGDRVTIEQVYPQVKRYILDVWSLGDDGLVVPRTGGWTWGDWGDNKDLLLLYNGWYYLALDGLGEMAKLVEDRETQRRVQQRVESIKKNFDRKFWRDKEYRSPDYTGLTDDRGQALAVVCGLAKPDHYPLLRQVFLNSRHASPYMEKYVLEALFRMGYPEDAMARMRDRYQPMVNSPLSTLWEGWGIGEAGYGGGSYNHGWSGGPLILLSQFAAGISPIEPAYRRFQVKPRLGSLGSIATNVHTVAGRVAVKVRQNKARIQLELNVPEGTIAEVCLPEQFLERLHVNNHRITNHEMSTGSKLLTDDGKIRALELQPGTWSVIGAQQ